MDIQPGFGRFLPPSELASYLRQFADEVERLASWEGSVAWEVPERVPDEYADKQVLEVIAGVRNGNDMGQGGFWMVRDMDRESNARALALDMQAKFGGRPFDVPMATSALLEVPSKVIDMIQMALHDGKLIHDSGTGEHTESIYRFKQ